MSNNKRKFSKRILGKLAAFVFLFQRPFTRMKVINYPNISPCIFALWHAHQCAVWSVKDHEHLYSLVSNSDDGQIITDACGAVGMKTIRGSYRRQGTKAALQLLEKLESNNSIAITIDGPRGPKHVVKEGVIAIAKHSQVPIVPMIWYCPSPLWLKFNSWDEFRFAIFACKTIVVYGDPIYIPAELTNEETEMYRLKVENTLKNLYDDAVANYKNYISQKN